jgi:putative FmdB family regulatory protein
MPIFEYVCAACATRFEELVPSSTSPAPPCPSCGAAGAQRAWSTFSTDWRPSFAKWHRMGSWGTKPPKKVF